MQYSFLEMESKAEREIISRKRHFEIEEKPEFKIKSIKAEIEEKPELSSIIGLLSERGYVVPDIDAQLRRPLADACSRRLTAHPASDPSQKILVIFCEAYQTKKQHAVEILSQIVKKEMVDKVILIMQSKMSVHAQKVLDEYPVKVETFLCHGHKNTRDREMEIEAERESKSKSKSKSSKRQKVVEGVSNKEKESRLYCHALQTLIDMLRDRGYVVPVMDSSLAGLRIAFGNHPKAASLRLTAHDASNSSRKIVAIFCEAHQTKEEDVVGVVSQILNKEIVEKVILVTHSEMDFDAQKVLNENRVRVQVETFLFKELAINFSLWVRLKCEIVCDEVKDKVLKMNEKQLKMAGIIQMPQGSMKARYFAFKKGQVLKISYGANINVSKYICIV